MRIVSIDNQNYIYNPISQMVFEKEDNYSHICRHIGYMRFDESNGKKYIQPIDHKTESVLRIKIKHAY